MIFILFVERWIFIHHFYRLMNKRQIQTLFLHNLTIHHHFIRDDFYFYTITVSSLQQTDCLIRHILAQWPIRGCHPTYSPITDTDRTNGKCRYITRSFHHGISCITHKISVVHIHTPSTHQQSCIRRQFMKLITDGINRIGTSIQ